MNGVQSLYLLPRHFIEDRSMSHLSSVGQTVWYHDTVVGMILNAMEALAAVNPVAQPDF